MLVAQNLKIKQKNGSTKNEGTGNLKKKALYTCPRPLPISLLVDFFPKLLKLP